MPRLVCTKEGNIEIVLVEEGELLELDPKLIQYLEEQFPEKNLIEIGEFILEALVDYLEKGNGCSK